MGILVAGLIVFLGIHSLRVFADGWRGRVIAKLGEKPWKGLFALVSLLGFVLIIWGFGQARMTPEFLYSPALWLRHLNSLLTLIALILVAAAYVPKNHLKARLGHPMLLGVKVWAFGHLLATGFLRDVVLFGAFLVWAIVLYAVSRRRDRAAGTTYPAGTIAGDIGAVVAGVVIWAAFTFKLHTLLIGVNPLA